MASHRPSIAHPAVDVLCFAVRPGNLAAIVRQRASRSDVDNRRDRLRARQQRAPAGGCRARLAPANAAAAWPRRGGRRVPEPPAGRARQPMHAQPGGAGRDGAGARGAPAEQQLQQPRAGGGLGAAARACRARCFSSSRASRSQPASSAMRSASGNWNARSSGRSRTTSRCACPGCMQSRRAAAVSRCCRRTSAPIPRCGCSRTARCSRACRWSWRAAASRHSPRFTRTTTALTRRRASAGCRSRGTRSCRRTCPRSRRLINRAAVEPCRRKAPAVFGQAQAARLSRRHGAMAGPAGLVVPRAAHAGARRQPHRQLLRRRRAHGHARFPGGALEQGHPRPAVLPGELDARGGARAPRARAGVGVRRRAACARRRADGRRGLGAVPRLRLPAADDDRDLAGAGSADRARRADGRGARARARGRRAHGVPRLARCAAAVRRHGRTRP